MRKLGLVLVLFTLAGSGCDCETGSLKVAVPRIEVSPERVDFRGEAGELREYAVQVTNAGVAPLVFDGAPELIEQDGDGNVEFSLSSLFERTCDERLREGSSPLTIAPGECATLVVRYLPKADGVDDTDLHLRTNDPEQPDLVVPFRGGALTPAIEACVLDGTTVRGCSRAASRLAFDLGAVALGGAKSVTLRLKSVGTAPLKIDGLRLSGDADFAVSPETIERTLNPTETASAEMTFTPLAGGERSASLVFSSNDPAQTSLEVRLVGQGDAPRLCAGLCENPDDPLERCEAAATDFGRIEPGSTVTRYAVVASCGTRPLTVQRAEVDQGGPTFKGTAGLTSARTLQAGQRLPPVTVTFAPTAEGTFTGRFLVTTQEGGEARLTLTGRGKTSGCKLDAPSSTFDFGQGVVNTERRRDLALSNRGTEDCLLPAPPSISAGADVSFAVVTAPTLTALRPGASLRVTLGYTARDLNGPDAGELTVPYAETGASGAPQKLKIALRGTPASQASCVLVAKPLPVAGVRTHDFGGVVVGTRRPMPVSFENVGAADCTLRSWSVTATSSRDSRAFTVEAPASAQLAPGASTLVPVTFLPTELRSYDTARLSVVTTDTAGFNGNGCSPQTAGCVGWALKGVGVESDLRIVPESLDFGAVTLGCRSAEQRVTIYNVGRSSVTIGGLRIEPAPPPEVFPAALPPTPLTLAPGGQATVPIRFRPPSEGPHIGVLLVTPQGSSAALAVPLRGSGTQESSQVDTFQQGGAAKTDVLFVIDNSGSMRAEQGFLADNAARFLSVAQQVGNDFQVGVVTTDMVDTTQSGRLQTTNGLPVITGQGRTAANNLASIVRSLGTSGSSKERGLDAMVAALSSPLIDDPTSNLSFLRTDARLAVVIVTDEEDHSTASTDYFVDFLQNIKGRYGSGLVSMSTIAGDPSPSTNQRGQPGCNGPGGDAVTGARYIDVASRTGGKFRSICASDWGQIANQLGLDAFATRSGFPLSRPATESTITVLVNGQPEPVGEWTHDAQGNGVVFDPAHVPPPGATVEVRYDAACQ